MPSCMQSDARRNAVGMLQHGCGNLAELTTVEVTPKKTTVLTLAQVCVPNPMYLAAIGALFFFPSSNI